MHRKDGIFGDGFLHSCGINASTRCISSAICALIPFERAEYEGIDYNHWFVDHLFVLAPAGFYVAQWLQSFREFPPRQKPGSFNLDRVMESITTGAQQTSN